MCSDASKRLDFHYFPYSSGTFCCGAGFEPDGGADEAEGGADLVGEEALEGEVEFDVAVCG